MKYLISTIIILMSFVAHTDEVDDYLYDVFEVAAFVLGHVDTCDVFEHPTYSRNEIRSKVVGGALFELWHYTMSPSMMKLSDHDVLVEELEAYGFSIRQNMTMLMTEDEIKGSCENITRLINYNTRALDEMIPHEQFLMLHVEKEGEVSETDADVEKEPEYTLI